MGINAFYVDSIGVYTKTTVNDSGGYGVETLVFEKTVVGSVRQKTLTDFQIKEFGLSSALSQAVKVYCADAIADNRAILYAGTYYDVRAVKACRAVSAVHHYEVLAVKRVQ